MLTSAPNNAMPPSKGVIGKMEGSIHPDKYGYKVHLRGKWFRRIKINEKWVSFKHSYQAAEEGLVLMNGDILRGKYDQRDWTSDEPLAFSILSEQFISDREREKVKSLRLIRNHIRQARNYFGTKNCRTIRYNELRGFYNSLPETMATKTKKNIIGTLHSFFQWVVDLEADRPNPITMPKFPKIPYAKPDMPKILSPEDQAKVLGRLMQVSPYKLFLGGRWCITYGLRWEELRQVKMKDFDNGYMTIWDWKQKHYKNKKLLQDDWQIAQDERAFGNEYFFRHESGRQYGKDYLYEQIRRVLKELGFYNVKAYTVIRHSTLSALNQEYSPEQIQKLFSLHFSDSIWHYIRYTDEQKQEIYAKARGKIGEIGKVKEVG